MKKKRIGLFLAVLFVGLAVSASFLLNGEDAPGNAYRTATVKRGDIKAVVSSTGKLAPLNTVAIGSQVSGNIKALYADYNSVVKKDQVIALIDPAVYEGQVRQAKAQLLYARMQLGEREKETAAAGAGVKNAEANLFSARSTFREAELNYARLYGLVSRKIVAGAELDSALTRRDNAQGSLQMAQAKVTTAKAHLEMALAQEKCAKAVIAEREAGLSLAEIKLGYCTIRSSIDGVVISQDVDVGQTVAATLQSPVLFTIAEDLTRMQVEVDVSEADVGRIKKGQGVEFTVDAFPDRTFSANVRQVRNAATSIQNVVTYKIIADMNNDSLLLRPGMTANVTVVVSTIKDSLTIPNSSLRFKPPGKIKEVKVQKNPPIRDRPFFKRTVETVGLDHKQAEEFVQIIQQAQQKLKAAYALPEGDRDLEQAWRGFFTQVLTRLHKILREEQLPKFIAYRSDLKDAGEKRRRQGGRQAKVYVPGEKGPETVRVTVGITDDSQTQIIGGELKEGDSVIIGLALGADRNAKPSGNLFSNLLKRGE
jgi:HlyD family secretion protein